MGESIRTSHIGSLPRSAALLEQLRDAGTGELSPSLIEEATRDVIERQADIGLDIANNGEQGRTGFHLHLLDRLSGFEGEGVSPFWSDVRDVPDLAAAEFDYPDADPETGAPRRPAATTQISYDGESAVQAELDLFFRLLEETGATFEDTFVTAPSPGIVATSLPNRYYDSHEAYLFDVADAMAKEYELIADTDALLQVDAPDLLHTHHREFHDGRDFSDRPYHEVLRLHVEAINRALANVPAARVRLHTCWGNYEGPHHRDIPLIDVLPELYRLNVGYLAVEQAGPRHTHEYRAFAAHPFPDDMTLMPGVIDVKSNVVDHPEAVADRLERIVEIVESPSRVIAVPDCGFGTLAWSGPVAGIAWAKLESLVEGAQIATDRVN